MGFTRANGKVRRSRHYMPNVTRVIVPPLAGMDGVGGWVEIFFNFTPVDDENHIWLITSNVTVTGPEAQAYRAKRDEYHQKIAEARPARDLALELMAGQHQFADMKHPDLVIIQDIAVQAGQGRIADRQSERLGRSDTAIILSMAKNPRSRTASSCQWAPIEKLETPARGRAANPRLLTSGRWPGYIRHFLHNK